MAKLSILREKETMTGKFWSWEQNKKGWVHEGAACMQMCMRADVCVRAYVWICECVSVLSKTVSGHIRTLCKNICVRIV